MCRLGTHGKDIKDQAGAVHDPDLKHFLYVAELLCRQLIIENDHTHLVFLVLYICLNLLQFSLTHKRNGVGHLKLLHKAFSRNQSCCFGQKSQFIEILLHLSSFCSGVISPTRTAFSFFISLLIKSFITVKNLFIGQIIIPLPKHK